MPDIINPYIAGNPVTSPEMFFGRDDVFQFIRQTLIGQHRDNVIVLYGQRRTGKTSVLYQLPSHLDARYLCVLVDLHGLSLEGLGGFLWELANHIIRILHRDYQIDLIKPDRTLFMSDPREYFEHQFLNEIWTAVGMKHILLLLDEAVRLQEQVQAGRLEHEIFEYIRHLMQHYEQLNFIFSLGSGLEEMEKEYSFLFNVGLYKKISFLDKKAACDLITQPVKDYFRIQSRAMDRVIQITSGHPYYIQLICHCMFNRWQQQGKPQIEIRDVNNVLEEAVERGSAVLKHVWEESTPAEKAFMSGIVTAMGEHNNPIDANTIGLTWMRYNVLIPHSEMVKAIRSLITRDVIAGQDKYMFTVDLQRLWIQKHRRLEWAKEEISDSARAWQMHVAPIAPAAPGLPESGRDQAVAGLVIGIFSLLVGFVPFLGAFVAIVGITLSAMGRRSISNRTKATVGLVLSIIGLVLQIIFLWVWYAPH